MRTVFRSQIKKFLSLKDENNMTEYIGLRAKIYALCVEGKKDMKKMKGIKSNIVARSIRSRITSSILNDMETVHKI